MTDVVAKGELHGMPYGGIEIGLLLRNSLFLEVSFFEKKTIIVSISDTHIENCCHMLNNGDAPRKLPLIVSGTP